MPSCDRLLDQAEAYTDSVRAFSDDKLGELLKFHKLFTEAEIVILTEDSAYTISSGRRETLLNVACFRKQDVDSKVLSDFCLVTGKLLTALANSKLRVEGVIAQFLKIKCFTSPVLLLF